MDRHLRNWEDRERVHPHGRVVHLQLAVARVDDVLDAVDSKRRLGLPRLGDASSELAEVGVKARVRHASCPASTLFDRVAACCHPRRGGEGSAHSLIVDTNILGGFADTAPLRCRPARDSC